MTQKTKFDRYLEQRGMNWRQYRKKSPTERAFIQYQAKLHFGDEPTDADYRSMGLNPQSFCDEEAPAKNLSQLKQQSERRSQQLEAQRAEKEKLERWEALKQKVGYVGDRRKERIFNGTAKDWKIPMNPNHQ